MKKEKTKQGRMKPYEAPMIEIAEIVIEQNILQSASGNVSPDDMPGEIW